MRLYTRDHAVKEYLLTTVEGTQLIRIVDHAFYKYYTSSIQQGFCFILRHEEQIKRLPHMLVRIVTR